MSRHRLIVVITIAACAAAFPAIRCGRPEREAPASTRATNQEARSKPDPRTASMEPIDPSGPPATHEKPRPVPEWKAVAERLRREARQDNPPQPALRKGETSAIQTHAVDERKVATSAETSRHGSRAELATTSAATSVSAPAADEAPEAPDPDASSDRKAPSLERLAFTPNRVREGGTSLLTVTASDDLSGIITVAGTVMSPSGKSVTGFTGVRQRNGKDYTATITVPMGAEQGRWYIRRLQIIDRAGNALDTTWNPESSFPSGILTVDSEKSDPEQLVLRSAYVEKRSIDAGERNTVFIEIAGGTTGIQGVHGVFRNPRKTAHSGFGCRFDPARSLWIGEIAIPPGGECGEWTLDQIQVAGKANERTTFDTSNPTVRGVTFQVGGDGPCDSAPPVVVWLTFTPGGIPNTGGTIAVTAFVTDDKSGVQNVSGRVEGPAALNTPKSPQLFFALRASGNPSEWVGVIRVPNHAAKGVWYLSAMQVVDKSGNQKVYSKGEPPVGTVSFRVE